MKRDFPLIILVVAASLSQYSMPVLLGAGADALQLGPEDAGLLPAAELSGFTLSALIAAPVWQRLARPVVVAVLIFVLASCQAVSGLFDSFPLFLGARVGVGIAMGMLVAAGFGLIAQQPAAERLYGRAIFFTVLASAGVIFLVPSASDSWGPLAVFGGMAVVSLLALPVAFKLPRARAAAVHDHGRPESGSANRPAIILFLLAVLLFSFANSAVYMFAERMGRNLDISAEALGSGLSLTYLVGLAGAWWANWRGSRGSYYPPLFIACLGLAVTGMGMVLASTPVLFFTSAGLLNLFVFLFVPYTLGLAAVLDASGRMAAALGALFPLGNALGAVVGGYLAGSIGYEASGWLCLVCCLLAALAFWPAAQLALNHAMWAGSTARQAVVNSVGEL